MKTRASLLSVLLISALFMFGFTNHPPKNPIPGCKVEGLQRAAVLLIEHQNELLPLIEDQAPYATEMRKVNKDLVPYQSPDFGIEPYPSFDMIFSENSPTSDELDEDVKVYLRNKATIQKEIDFWYPEQVARVEAHVRQHGDLREQIELHRQLSQMDAEGKLAFYQHDLSDTRELLQNTVDLCHDIMILHPKQYR
jgi:hypothetical protein